MIAWTLWGGWPKADPDAAPISHVGRYSVITLARKHTLGGGWIGFTASLRMRADMHPSDRRDFLYFGLDVRK
jgi:hypothetical protein